MKKKGHGGGIVKSDSYSAASGEMVRAVFEGEMVQEIRGESLGAFARHRTLCSRLQLLQKKWSMCQSAGLENKGY